MAKTTDREDSPTALLAELVELSRLYGSRPEFLIGGGGNTSVKTADRLWVKSSGVSLATIDADGFVELDRPRLAALLATDLGRAPVDREKAFKAGTLAARVAPERGQRPSVESLLHHLLAARFVVHTHPVLPNMFTCCVAGRGIVAELFGDEALWLDYTDPGYTLARALNQAVADYANRTGRACPPAILVQNHGLFVCGESGEEVRRRTDDVMNKLAQRVGEVPAARAFGPAETLSAERADKLIRAIAPTLRGLLGQPQRLPIVLLDTGDWAVAMACGAAGRAAAEMAALTPDHLIYCGSHALWFEPPDGSDTAVAESLKAAVADHAARHGAKPQVVVVRGLGIFSAGGSLGAARTAREMYDSQVQIVAGAQRLGGVNPMSDGHRRFIQNWEAESYRLAVLAGAAGGKRAAGKVALVTGAAQGFGLEIAQDLAANGACVALADVNVAGAIAAAEQIERLHGPGSAVGLAMNVTDPASAAAGVAQVLRAFGGLDLVVSNAGVLRAESVKTQPAKDFDFVTAVNYKGYFVVVQAVAGVLAAQHRAQPGYRSDIVQINSKSGLMGSNRNGAYAGSKFGGIGLTQSFALELIEDGVKVNSICPGNFFDGPLWSDPANGLFVQYLRTGKVPGAETVEDVRRAYEAKVPMGRGCTTADVMKAVYYLVEQQYETGQALPVTGGQVMLS